MSKPLPDEVAKRLLILKYQVVHSLASPPQEVIQKLYFQWSREDQRKFVNGFKERSDQLVRSMKKNNLWELMTREEREFIASVPPKDKTSTTLERHVVP